MIKVFPVLFSLPLHNMCNIEGLHHTINEQERGFLWAGELAQSLRALAVVAKYLGSIPAWRLTTSSGTSTCGAQIHMKAKLSYTENNFKKLKRLSGIRI